MPPSMRRPVGVTGAQRSDTREIPLPGMCWPNMVMMADSESRPAMSVMPLASIRRPAIGSNFRTLNAESPTRTAGMKLPTRKARRGQPEPSQDHHRAEYVAEAHSLEGGLHLVQLDLLGDERVEVERALPVEVDQHRKVARGQAVAVPGRLQRPASAEDVDQRQIGHLHLRSRDADQDHRASQVAGIERLLPGLRPADRIHHHIGALCTLVGCAQISSMAPTGSSADESTACVAPILFA